MKRRIIQGFLVVLFSGFSSFALSEDIDLFVERDTGSVDRPNVLLVLDNGANFSASADFPTCPGEDGWPTAMADTVGGIEQCALYKVIKGVTPGSVNLGVMLFNESGFNPGLEARCDGPDSQGLGGCLVYESVNLTADRKQAVLDWIKGWKTSGSTESGVSYNVKTNNKKNAAVMQEAWAYFAGRRGLSGVNYSGVAPTATCSNNYVIFVGNAWGNNGQPGDGGSNNYTSEKALLGTLTAAPLMNAQPAATLEQITTISGPVPVSCGASDSFTFSGDHLRNGYYADEWVRYMFSQGIKTYSVGILGSSCQASYEALLKSMGDGVGGGKYFPTNDYDELKTALEEALTEIQSVNSVFASVSLPVSVNTQGTYLNQVFVGMFRPGDNALPRWYGNLKQYKLGYGDGGNLELLDADGKSAISSGNTGFIAECARSFWTPMKSASSSNLYWASIDDANCGPTYSAKSETPDGNMVEKGGQGYMLRNLAEGEAPAGRNVLTCNNTIDTVDNGDGTTTTTGSACTSTLANFDQNNTAIKASSLGVADADRAGLIKWARGENLDAEAIANSTVDASGNITNIEQDVAVTMMRPSSHGDVVHSRPVAINYASSDTADPEVVVFYGGNDGMLRAVNGNREDGESIGNKAPGEELWSFVAPESYGMLRRLRDNSPLISYPTVTGGSPKDYGFDGPVAAYREGSDAWIYATMRRGGRMLYSFDVSTPYSPSLKWRVGCNDAGCTSSRFADMGQTWSVPIVLKSASYTSVAGANKPMLIMGGGYDDCEDEDPAACSGITKGRGIYLLDADSGAWLNTFATDGRVIGDVMLVKDSQGLAQYGYAADLSGNVYRIHARVCDADGVCSVRPLGEAAPVEWRITKIASLGGSGTDARKFMFGPDVVVDGDTHYLLIGSGDREKPLASYTSANRVQNYFFMIKDQPGSATWLSSESSRCSAERICLASLYNINTDDTPTDAEMSGTKGWALELDSSEKVVTSALTIFGTVYFSTHQPWDNTASASSSTCEADLGDSRSYSINYKNAEGLNGSRYADLVGDGLPPSPVAGLVTLDDDTTVPFCIGCDPTSPLQGGEPPVPPGASQPKARVFWNIEQ